MAARDDPVLDALDGWRTEGLIDDATHDRLSERATAQAEKRRAEHASRFIMAAGAIVLVAAFVVLATIFWEDLSEATRAGFLWVVSALVLTLGLQRIEAAGTQRLGPWLALAAVPLAIFAATLTRDWREEAVDPLVIIAVAAVGLLIGLLGTLYAQRTPIIPVGAYALFFVYGPFAGATLDVRDFDPIVWGLDVLVVAGLFAIGAWIILRPDEQGPVARGTRTGWMWIAFVAAVPLIAITWYDVLDYSSEWGPIIAYAVLAGLGLAFGIRYARNGILVLASLLLIGDAWFLGMSQGEQFGTFLALLFSAGVLLWLGNRLGIGPLGKKHEPAPPGNDAAGSDTSNDHTDDILSGPSDR